MVNRRCRIRRVANLQRVDGEAPAPVTVQTVTLDEKKP